MSEEWLEYLRENAPDLYEQAVASRKHDTKWRDNYIRDLEAQLAQLVELLKAARCPNCDGSGAYMVSGGPEQCQWCDERATAIWEGK